MTTEPAPSARDLDHAVIRFAGDSGDGIQLTGSEFARATALHGNDFATFPDYPAEIRAPVGTPAGVSGYRSSSRTGTSSRRATPPTRSSR
jgi:2-oxoglutarate ferredoxin oxidoreductase subunit alpha